MTCLSSLPRHIKFCFLRPFVALLLSLLVIASSGCGFHLRGSSPLPTYLESLSLDWQGGEAPFRQHMEKGLQRAGISLQHDERPAASHDNSTTPAPISLHLRHQVLPKRPITFAGNGLVAQYELAQQIEFQLGITDASTNWQTISVTRQYDYVPNNVTANQAQERQLGLSMQRELIQQLIRRLQFTQVQLPSENRKAPSENRQDEQS